jgi:hypothetical protein
MTLFRLILAMLAAYTVEGVTGSAPIDPFGENVQPLCQCVDRLES